MALGFMKLERKHIVAAANDTDAVDMSTKSIIGWLVATAAVGGIGLYSYIQWGTQIQGWLQ